VAAITDAVVVAVFFHKNITIPMVPLVVLRALTMSMARPSG